MSTDAVAQLRREREKRRARHEQEGGKNAMETPGDIPLVPLTTAQVPPFPLEVLPATLRPFAEQVAVSLNVPLDYVGPPMLAVAAACVGGDTVLCPKADRTVTASTFLLIIGPPGDGKTPALEKTMEPLRNIQRAYGAQYAEADAQYKQDYEAWEQDKKSRPKPAPPRMQQAFTTDTTSEALGELLHHTPRGVMVYQEEAAGFVLSLNQYKGGKGSDKQRWLSLWSGVSIVLNRRGRQEYVDRPFVCFLGGIQPEVLTGMGSEISEHDGFIHRFLAIYPDPLPKRASKTVIAPESAQAWTDCCREIDAMMGQDDGSPFPVTLATGAAEAWYAWLDKHFTEQNATDFPEPLRGPWAKLESYYLRLTLVLHMIRVAAREISEEQSAAVDTETMRRAELLMHYLKAHARRVYDQLHDSPADRRIVAVAKWMKRHNDQCKPRDLQMARVAGVRTADQARAMIEMMAKRGHVTVTGAGRSIEAKLVTESDVHE